MQMVCIEGESQVQKNMPYFLKSQLISVIGGYVTSGVMLQLPELQKAFEDELIKSRLITFSVPELVYVLRLFSQA
jgi:hypothetical protein